MPFKFHSLLFISLLSLRVSGSNAQVQDPPFWLNEVYLSGSRTGDGVEFVCKSGELLTRAAVQIYNGLDSTATTGTIWAASRTDPSFVCPDSTSGFSKSALGISSINNIDDGRPLAFCMFSATTGEVFQFVGFGLQGTATEGACVGMSPTNSGVTTTNSGLDAHLTGDGCFYKDFTWIGDSSSSNLNRIPNNGQSFNCVPSVGGVAPDPVTPGADGDPHFKTWSGSFYDYMGACDLVLIHAPSFDQEMGKTLVIAIRTKIRYAYSYIESAAIKIGDGVFEVSSFGNYALNGVESAEMPNKLSGYSVNHTQVNEKVHDFVIDLGNGEEIELRTFKDWVSVKLHKPHMARYHDSVGMMGEFGTGKLLARDGVTVIEDPNALADEWQVHDTEGMIFRTARAPQYPARCEMPDSTQKVARRRLGEKYVTQEAAENACVTAGAENMAGCIHDVMAIDDLELAAAGAF